VDKYLHTEGKKEQRGRIEDGPTRIKPKWSAWISQKQVAKGGRKGSGKQAIAGKTSAGTKSSGKEAGATGAKK